MSRPLKEAFGQSNFYRLIDFSHSRQETREGQQRPINKDYYYIDFHATIDAIKYRVYYLTQRVKDLYKPSEDKKDYHCLRCKSEYTTLEVLDSVGPMGFLCHRCGNLLEERDDRNAGISTGHEKQSRLANQLSKLLKLLQQIDAEDIPKNDFEAAFAVAVPVQRDELINPVRATEPLQTAKGPPKAVKGITDQTAAPLEVSLTTSTERTAAEQAAEAKRKADLAAQNSLPVWHTNSTVTGEATALGAKQQERLRDSIPSQVIKVDEEEKKDGTVLNDELAAYYAQILQEKAKEAREDREADESSNDEDDDNDEGDFEDVGIVASQADTPSSSMSTNANGTKNITSHAVTRKRRSDSGSSAPGTNHSTPVAAGTVLDESRAAKRPRVENGENGLGAEKSEAMPGNADSDEDDEEFEDAL